MPSLYEVFMLPTLPNYLSCHNYRCFDGLNDAVCYHLDYIRVLQMYYCVFSMNLLQTYTCLFIDNRCVDKRKRYAFYKMTMHSPHSQNKTYKQLYKPGSGFGKFKNDSSHMILYIHVRKSYFQTSDFYTYCSVTYVIYNHNIINMHVLSLSPIN